MSWPCGRLARWKRWRPKKPLAHALRTKSMYQTNFGLSGQSSGAFPCLIGLRIRCGRCEACIWWPPCDERACREGAVRDQVRGRDHLCVRAGAWVLARGGVARGGYSEPK